MLKPAPIGGLNVTRAALPSDMLAEILFEELPERALAARLFGRPLRLLNPLRVDPSRDLRQPRPRDLPRLGEADTRQQAY